MADLSIFDLSGKKALVTGGGGGIGKACAIGLAKAGADVAIIDFIKETGEETVKEIKELGRKSIFLFCDVTDAGQVSQTVKQVVNEFGRLDIAFNNAGGGTLAGGDTIGDDALDVWQKVIDLNLNSLFYCNREEAKYMIPQRYGKIINMASMDATIISKLPMSIGIVAYCVSKAGIKHLTKALAMEWVQYNIHVNSVSPGIISTPATQSLQDTPELLELVNGTTPMHRLGKPDELVGGVIYLASDSSSFTTGLDLIMDGGHTVW